jgi:hypothetical protein
MIEEREGSLNLVETTARGAPAVQNTTNKRKARSLVVPHIALEDIVFEEYRGRVGTVDFTDASKAYFFPVGVPGLFRQYNAPADFVETANTIGLPRYAKQAVDQQFARWVMLHVQSNPLPICTRPRVLIKGKRT